MYSYVKLDKPDCSKPAVQTPQSPTPSQASSLLRSSCPTQGLIDPRLASEPRRDMEDRRRPRGPSLHRSSLSSSELLSLSSSSSESAMAAMSSCCLFFFSSAKRFFSFSASAFILLKSSACLPFSCIPLVMLDLLLALSLLDVPSVCRLLAVSPLLLLALLARLSSDAWDSASSFSAALLSNSESGRVLSSPASEVAREVNWLEEAFDLAFFDLAARLAAFLSFIGLLVSC
mmetsp:Transcript_26569/g.48061  ORF Transcript_26569/g.48061 Transcript_26569/m.48061 type:complete len:231 (+) Transcript_26569:36-728(+)